MYKLFSGAALVALTAAVPAFAADLAVKAPAATPTAPVPFSWTGCHVGGDVGGVVSQDKFANGHSFSSPGFMGGGQIGCDYQFAPRWVVGVEGKASWSSLKYSNAGTVRSLATGAVHPSQFTFSNDFLASVTARLGYSFADRWLVFARGGAAWTHEKADDAFTSFGGIAVDPSATMTRTGWTVGTGVEWGFAPHWSANLEYNYYNFGTRSVRLNDNAAGVFVNFLGITDTIHAATVGVNYHF